MTLPADSVQFHSRTNWEVPIARQEGWVSCPRDRRLPHVSPGGGPRGYLTRKATLSLCGSVHQWDVFTFQFGYKNPQIDFKNSTFEFKNPDLAFKKSPFGRFGDICLFPWVQEMIVCRHSQPHG